MGRRCSRPPKKARYASEIDARMAVWRGGGAGGIRAYLCEFCGGWHTTSPSQGDERAEVGNPSS